MGPEDLLNKYSTSKKAFEVVLDHSKLVLNKAIEISDSLVMSGRKVDLKLVERGALLHDIGVFFTYAPKIGCFGNFDYMQHGVLGFLILMKEGFRDEAYIALRHIGVGLRREDVINSNLPLLPEDMSPLSIEEKIVCVADLFFSKSVRVGERSIREVIDVYENLGKKRELLKLFNEVGILY